MNVKIALFGALVATLLLTVFDVNSTFAQTLSDILDKPPSNSTYIPILNETEKKKYSEILDSALALSQEIISYKEPLDEKTKKLINEKKVKIEELMMEADMLYPFPPLVEISPEREAELTTAMWKMAWTKYPFVTMGIEPHTGAIGITLDETKVDVNDRDEIEQVLRSIAGDKITLNIYYMENKIQFQGSCNGQAGKCSTIIGASKGEPDHIEDVDCTINIVATKGYGSSKTTGVVIPHHCNEHHSDYYQSDKRYRSHEVGSHHTDGGWFCDCDFVEIDSRPSATGKINDNGDDMVVSYGDLSKHDKVIMIGQNSGKKEGKIAATNQWWWDGPILYTDVYYVTGIDFTTGDSGAPIVRPSDSKYGGMNIGGGAIQFEGREIMANIVHEWSFLKSKLGLNE